MSALSTAPGFANPVEDAQAVFRAALDALARPGIPVPLPALPPPLAATGLSQGMLALALTLCDNDTPLWLDAAADTPQMRHHLRFHTASPFAESPMAAAFAFIAQPLDMPRLDAFHPGETNFPDRSATLIINVDFSEHNGESRELTGPGVKGNDEGHWQGFSVAGLPLWFWENWEANHAAYPLGVDVIFVESSRHASGAAQVRLLGLPRTARVRKKTAAQEQPPCT